MPRAQKTQQADPSARFSFIDEHIRLENTHDLDGIMGTFGGDAIYGDEPWGETHRGLAEVRRHYENLLQALPDLHIEVKHRYGSPDAVAYEVVISGTHLGPWRGIPATGRPVSFPLVAIYTFTPDDRLAGEHTYYDRATVQRQLGFYREPDTLVGRLSIAVMHPWMIAEAYAGSLLGRR
jgi:steroid delta-isomerase-like uncharacterized protein